MRKRFTLILIMGVIMMTLNAQNKNLNGPKTFYLFESFEAGIPDTWTIETTGDISWEHAFDYAIANSSGYPSLHVAGYLTSPEIDISNEMDDVRLLFNHYNWSMGGTSTAIVEVFDGTDWVDVGLPSDYGEVDIDVSAYKNDAFKVRFFYDDNSQWVLHWKLYDVLIYSPEEYDMAVTKISPSSIVFGESAIPQITVRNYGVNPGSYDLQLTINGTSYDESLTGLAEVLAGEEVVIDFPEWESPDENNYEITAVLSFANDEDLTNNTKEIICMVKPYTDAAVGNNNGKYYEVNLENGDMSPIGSFESIPFSMADEYADGKVYRMTEWMDFHEVGVDGELTKITEADLYDQWTALGYAPFNYAMAYEWDTQRMYIAGDDGAGWPVGNPHLAYFDMETYELVYVGEINNTGDMIVGMDFADDGFLYGVGLDGDLYKINVDEFEVEVVGATGLGSIDKDFQDVSYDRADHILYGIFRHGNPWSSSFGSFDLETGEFTVIQDYDLSNYVCFAITKDPVQTYTLTFSIDDGTDPIEGAGIAINGETLTTNTTGNASVELANGDYDYTVTYTGFYDYSETVTIEDDNEEVMVTMDEITGINSLSFDFGISPNPSNGKYKISSMAEFTFEVYDINGTKVYSDNEGKTESIIDITKQAKGIYFLKIRSKSDSRIIKLVKN